MVQEKILYVLPQSNFFNRDMCGSINHALGFISGMSANGFKVEVLAGNVRDDYREVKVVWHSLTQRLFLFSLISFLVKRRNQYAKIFIRYKSAHMFALPLLKLFPISRRVVIEVNSIRMSYGNRWRLLNTVERLCLKCAENRYVVSQGLYDALGLPDSIIVENGSVNRNQLILPNPKKRQRLVYLGTLKKYYDLHGLIDLGIKLSEKEIEVHIYGGGPEIDGLMKYERSVSKGNIFFHGPYAYDSLYEIVYMDDIFIVPYKAGTVADHGSPTKLFELMSIGGCVLASRVGSIPNILQNGNTGYLYDDWEHAGEIIDKLMLSRNIDSIGRSAREFFNKHYTWKARTNELINKLQ